jgi:hypothetical protein
VREELGSLATPLRAELAAASDLLADIVRRDWPFLARVAAIAAVVELGYLAILAHLSVATPREGPRSRLRAS